MKVDDERVVVDDPEPHHAIGVDVIPDGALPDQGHSGVIDFGCAGVGDPACDLVIAFTFLSQTSRAAFRDAIALDEASWQRARGWAIWKALITLVQHRNTHPGEAKKALRAMREVLTDYSRRNLTEAWAAMCPRL